MIVQDAQSVLILLRGYMELCIYPPQPTFARTKQNVQHSDDDTGATLLTPSADNPAGSPHSVINECLGQTVDHDVAQEQLPLAWSCSEDSILQRLQARDPRGKGLPGRLALRLLFQLLHWSPHLRPTPQQTLLHAYFTMNESDIDRCHTFRYVEGWC